MTPTATPTTPNADATPATTAPFPARKAALWLTAVSLALWAVIATVVTTAWPHLDRAHESVALTVAVVWGATILSLIPMVTVSRRGVIPIVSGYFVGAALRFAISLVAAVLAVKVWDMPVNVVLITLAVTYPPLLFVETAMVGKHLWRFDTKRRTGLHAGLHSAIHTEVAA